MSCEVRSIVALPVHASRFQRLVDRGLRKLRYNPKSANVSIAFVGDRRMSSLNTRYRGMRATTDVLSFPGRENELGEIIISVPQARRQASLYGQSLARELDLLVVHGLLHLIGYDHLRPKERARMTRKEVELLGGRSLIRRKPHL